MDIRKIISFGLGFISSLFFMSFIYLITSHRAITEIKKDMNSVKKYVHEIHSASTMAQDYIIDKHKK